MIQTKFGKPGTIGTIGAMAVAEEVRKAKGKSLNYKSETPWPQAVLDHIEAVTGYRVYDATQNQACDPVTQEQLPLAVNADFTVSYPVQAKSFAQVKTAITKNINDAFTAAVTGGKVDVGGWEIDVRRTGDKNDIQNMRELCDYFLDDLGVPDATQVSVRGADNLDHVTTVGVLRDSIIPAMRAYALGLFQNKHTKLNAIEAVDPQAEDAVAQLVAIVW